LLVLVLVLLPAVVVAALLLSVALMLVLVRVRVLLVVGSRLEPCASTRVPFAPGGTPMYPRAPLPAVVLSPRRRSDDALPLSSSSQ
jgi:hypothetical protein